MTASDLREARQALGWTQAELAERLGLSSRERISAMENGREPISKRTANHVRTLLQLHDAA